MARSKAASADTAAVRARLRKFVREHYRNWHAFVEQLQVPRTTSDGWKSTKGSSMPDSAWLLRLAQYTNLSVDWLLLGEGTMLRHKPDANTPREQLRRVVEAELRQTENVTPQEFQAAWDRLLLRSDFEVVDELVFEVAVDAVRQRFRETLRLVRHYALVVFVYQSFRNLHIAEEAKDPKRAQEARQRFEEVMAVPLDGDLDDLWRMFTLHAAEVGLLRPPRDLTLKAPKK